MGRFNAASEIDNYGGNGGGGYFSLKNDKDVARVRFMYNTIDDVDGYAVHQVEVNGKKRWVSCLRDYNDPVSKCPLCEAGQFQQVRLFVPIYDVDSGKVLVWERGKKFFQKINSVCSRYAKGGVVSHIFEIERNGKAGDTQTTYEIYEVDQDNTRLEDLPELPKIIGGLVLDKNSDEMREYLSTKAFPGEDTNKSNSEQPLRRREAVRDDYDQPRRRTPSGEF